MISDVAPNHDEIINHLQVDNQPHFGGLNRDIGSCNLHIQLAVFLLSLLKHGSLSKAGGLLVQAFKKTLYLVEVVSLK
jgi:hypothetical protein